MIINNPDEQVWRMLTGGAGSSAGRIEIDKLKRMLQARAIYFVVDRDERYHWLRLRSRRDLQMIQVQTDTMATGEAALLQLRYNGAVHTGLTADAALSILLQYYDAEADIAQQK